MNGPTDNIKLLQEKICLGDEHALSVLYQLLYKKLHRFSKGIVRSGEVAEEIVEDVFVKLWSNRSTITQIDNLTVYVYVAVKNKSLNTLSHKARELVTAPFDYLDIDWNESAANPYDVMINAEMMQSMQKAIEALPPRCKMIFKLVREDGLKYKEVAQVLNISVNTIDAQMAIAVKRICTALHLENTAKGLHATPARKKC